MRLVIITAAALLAAACNNGKGYHDGVHANHCKDGVHWKKDCKADMRSEPYHKQDHKKEYGKYSKDMLTNNIRKNVNLRSGPGTNYRVVGKVMPGESVAVHECQGNWCKVEKDMNTGWVAKRFFK
tara:strand:+ start:284 stop:658 length:375 start_codon:yes stop_codon:yes gene_type:complete